MTLLAPATTTPLLSGIPAGYRLATLDDLRREIAARADRLVGRQRGKYDAERAATIRMLQDAHDILRGITDP